jgi:O-antigen/teichoic acid export membrane protein
VLPALSEVTRSKPQELKAAIYRVRRPLDIVCVVPAGALFVLGEAIIRILYDARYQEAGWMLRVVALTLAMTQYNVFDQCLIALGKMRLLSALNLVRLVGLYAMIPLFYWQWGVKGAIFGVPASALLNVIVQLCVQARLHLLDIKRELLVVPLFGAGVLAGWLVSLLLPWAK